MASCKLKMKALRYLVCVACGCSSMIEFELCGTVKTWAEAKEADFECGSCRQVKQLKKEIDDLKAMLGARGHEEAKSVNNNRTAHKVTTTTRSKKTGGKRLGEQFMVLEDLGLQKE